MSADWWQNFANNFAGDLAPLISLFGESPTKQYLSETLTFIDIFIFSMAPIGVITAIVSAIRVAGGPSLRAFIGRAQEGAGMAEAELCSSTSRNVCELYTNGGIARVFGRPKILEFVHDWKPDPTSNQREPKSHNKPDPTANQQERKSHDEPDTTSHQQEPNSYDKAGIYSFGEFLSYEHWQEQGTRPDEEKISKPTYRPEDFAPHPNLSLNVGIKKLHWSCFYLAAILGFLLQAGVLAFAALITYKYPSEFRRDDSQIAVPAFPFVCTGTVLLCIGVGMCASIIENSTYERTFERKKNKSSRLYWIQPGDQVVGDQVFDSFAYSDAKSQLKEYTTSKREIERSGHAKQFLTTQSILVWIAISTTTVGFALQFLGLRALHSTVSVAQLGVMVIMSVIRGLLRTRRLEEEHNLLGDSNTLYLHHELDWLAIEMALENHHDSACGLLDRNWVSRPSWRITAPDVILSLSAPRPQRIHDEFKEKAAKAYLKRVKLAQMTGTPTLASTSIIGDPWEEPMVASRIWASKLACAIEGAMGVIIRRCTVKDTLRQPNPWDLRCWMGSASGCSDSHPSESTIEVTIIHNEEGTGLHGPWKVDRAQLESVLGLWLWSMISVERIRRLKDEGSHKPSNSVTRTARLTSVLKDSDSSDSEAGLELWLGSHSAYWDREKKKRKEKEKKLESADATFYPGRLWVEHANEDVVSAEDARKKQSPAFRRIFGSNIISINKMASNWRSPSRVSYVSSTSSLEMMCAQELFAIFFSAVVPEIKEIRGNTEIVEGPDKYYVANSTLSEMVEVFTSSGIGNYDDAIACMVPVLHSAEKLSYSSAFMAARAAGEEHHQRKDWKRAENVLSSALKLALQGLEGQTAHLPGDTERTGEIHACLLSQCELYRWALQGDKRTRLFGLRGFVSLFKLFRKRWSNNANDGTYDLERIPEDLLLYRSVALEFTLLEKDNDINNAIQELGEPPRKPKGAFVGDFHRNLCIGSLYGALYRLEPSILRSCDGRPVLARAAQHGWYPVMKSLQGLGIDTREVDHDGLNYLHHAARSCNAVMFNDLVGDDVSLLSRTDNFGREPLHLAAAAGRTDVVLLLTRHFSARRNTEDKFSRSPLDTAILSDHLETFNFLSNLEKKENAESHSGKIWELEIKWLTQAACCCSIKIVLGLLAAIINSISIEPLRFIKNRLIQCKKDLETDEDDKARKFIEILDLLGEYSSSTEKWRIKGRTAISLAAEARGSHLIPYFLENCAESSIAGTISSGRTCLHHAVISQSEPAVEALINLNYASDLMVKDKDGLDPLEYALIDRSFTIASMLLRKDSRGKNLILPGTALATTGSRLYFQGTDSRIRGISVRLEPEEPLVFPISPRLFTPLTGVGDSKQVLHNPRNFTLRIH